MAEDIVTRLRSCKLIRLTTGGGGEETSSPLHVEAADRIEQLEAALRETLSFVETYSYRWDGFNETPPAILLERAKKALARLETVPDDVDLVKRLREYGVPDCQHDASSKVKGAKMTDLVSQLRRDAAEFDSETYAEAAYRIEQLEVALRQLAETDLTGIAIKALGGKDG